MTETAGQDRCEAPARRVPYLGLPYPLLDYALGELTGDYGKILLRVAQLARATSSTVDGIALDIGESLIDERSERIWGGMRLDREVSPEGRRALVRRVLERLERDGWISRRAARESGPGNDPRTGPRSGPSPTVVRFLRYREILWPACAAPAQETAHDSAQESAPSSGPIPPEKPPDPPGTPEKPSRAPAARRRKARSAEGEAPDPRHRPLQDRLEAVFLDLRRDRYGFHKRDAKAITELLRLSGGDVAEVERRWRVGLGEAGFRRCDTIHELADRKWNAYAGGAEAGPRPAGAPVPAKADGFGKGGGF